MDSNSDKLKLLASIKALDYVEDDYIIGIGSGTTVRFFLEKLAEKIKSENLNIKGVPTSLDTALKMKKYGIPIVDFMEIRDIDLAVDGADSVLIEEKILIKGGGGAFTREKIVDYWAKRLIIIVDESKIDREFPIPLEVIPFSINYVKDVIGNRYGGNSLKIRLCQGKLGPCISDNGNIILDLHLRKDEIKRHLEMDLNSIPGIIENGIFSRSCTVIIAKKGGHVVEMRMK